MVAFLMILVEKLPDNSEPLVICCTSIATDFTKGLRKSEGSISKQHVGALKLQTVLTRVF